MNEHQGATLEATDEDVLDEGEVREAEAGTTDSAPTSATRTIRSTRIAIVLALAVLTLVNVLYASSSDGGPDEGNHIEMVAHHARNLRLLTWEETQYEQMRGHPYYLYSPVSYLPYIPAYWAQQVVPEKAWGREPTRNVVRLGGILFSAAIFFVLLALARRVVPDLHPVHHVGLAFVVSMVPQVRYITSYVTSDAYAILVGTLSFAMAARLLAKRSLSYRDTIYTGLVVTAVAHSRYNTFPTLATLGAAFLVTLFRTPRWRERLRRVVVVAGIPAAFAGWFYITTYAVLGNGHLLATSDAEQLVQSTFDGALVPAIPVRDLIDLNWEKLDLVWTGAFYNILGIPDAEPWISTTMRWFAIVGMVVVVVAGWKLLSRAGLFVTTGAVLTVFATWGLMLTWPYQLGRFLLPAMLAALLGGVAVFSSAFGKLIPRGLARIGGAPTLAIVIAGATVLWMNVMVLNESIPRAAK